MKVDIEKFVGQLLTSAQANLEASRAMRPDYGASTAHDAVREALQEAHSSLSQPAFFAALDALGGQRTAMDIMETKLLRIIVEQAQV